MKRRLLTHYLPIPSIRVYLPVLLVFLTFRVSAQTITTVAGSDLKGDGGPATGANLNNPQGVAIDGNGNIYIADQYNNRIRKVATNGTITTVAGTGTQGFSGDGGAATSATLYNPTNVAVDGTGNLYIADYNNHRIRKVTVGGIISTVAGTGTQGFSGDGGPATSANLKFPTGVTVDGSGMLFIADSQNQRVRKVTSAGVISTVAGTGTSGYSGDGGDATLANLQFPYGVLVDGTGTLFIADQNNHRIRKVATNGIISTVAGNGIQGAGGDGGLATNANLYYPFGMAVDGTGNLFIADLYNHRIRKVATNGIISTVAGTGTAGYGGDGGPATSANLNYPAGVAVDGSGNLFIADLTNKRIRKVTPGGVISTVAGNGTANFGGDGGQAVSASLYNLQGVAVDGAGNLFIADRDNHRIRKVTAGGVITTIAGNGVGGFSGDGGPATSAGLQYPTAVAVDGSGNLFIADRYNNRIRKVAGGTISTVAGNGNPGFSGDAGAATSATLYFPTGIAVDGSGNLFIADQANSRIRKVTSGGIISTVAGNGTASFGGDSGPATSAMINNPTGVGVDGTGNLFIADQVNNRVRKVTPAGVISTVAGNGTPNSSGDGGPATSASLQYPASVAVDGSGNLFIADQYNNRIRKVTTGGTIFTVAGNGTSGFSGDGGQATSAMLNNPTGVVVDGSGNLFIADQTNQRVRKVSGPVRVSVSPANPGAVCSGSGFSLTATAVNITPTSYTWSSQPAGLSATGATPTFTAPVVNTPTTYTLTVTATDGTVSPTASVTILVNALPGAPTLVASATSTLNQPISVTATGCAGSINWTVLGGSGSASGPIYTLTQPGNYTLSASCSLNGCTSSVASLSLTIQANAPLALTAPDYNCQTGAITFRTTGGDGSLIEYFATGITDWTSEPHQTVSQSLQSDPKKVQLQARQNGVVVGYLFDLPAFCAGLPTPPQSSTNPAPVLNQSIASQTAVQGQAYSFTIPVGTFTDPQGETLTYYSLGLPSGLSLTGSTISGTPSSVTQTTVTIIAVDPSGQTANTSFTLQVNPAVGQSCASVMSGNWSSSATWSCGRVPLVTDEVTINAGHTVNLTSDGVAKKVTLLGVLTQASGVRLRINGL